MSTRTDRNQVFGPEGVLLLEEVVVVDTTLDTNRSAIETYLRDAYATIDGITGQAAISATQADVRLLQGQVKDLARMNKRLVRLALRAFDATG